MQELPPTIAIAGAWGYIGRKFLDAALGLGIKSFVYDPGEAPADLPLTSVTRLSDETAFYRLQTALFHLALHPQHRTNGFYRLLERSNQEPILILNEKPIARPEHPAQCRQILQAVEQSRALVLYDFPELFDPVTHRILQFLSGFEKVEITHIYLYRGKDREAAANPRNYKPMVHIQYQESVHCLAFILYLLGTLEKGFQPVLSRGISVTAAAQPYCPPNPEAYPYVVDGKCDFALSLGRTTIEGHTDFKQNALLKKQRIIKGLADQRPFTIEADYLEGHKYLTIDGRPQPCDPGASSYQNVLSTLWHWYTHVDRDRLLHGLYPHPEFAWLTFQLSSALWRSSWDQKQITFSSLEELVQFEAGFAAAQKEFCHY